MWINVLQIIIGVHSVLGLSLFWIARYRQPIRCKYSPHGLFVFGHLYGNMFCILLLQRWIRFDSISSNVVLSMSMFFFPMFFGAYLLRAYRLFNVFQWKEGAFEAARNAQMNLYYTSTYARAQRASIGHLRIYYAAGMTISGIAATLFLIFRSQHVVTDTNETVLEMVGIVGLGVLYLLLLGFAAICVRRLHSLVQIHRELLGLVAIFIVQGVLFCITQLVPDMKSSHVDDIATIIAVQISTCVSIWYPLIIVLRGSTKTLIWEHLTSSISTSEVYFELLLSDTTMCELFRCYLVSDGFSADPVYLYEELQTYTTLTTTQQRRMKSVEIIDLAKNILLNDQRLFNELCVFDKLEEIKAETYPSTLFDSWRVLLRRQLHEHCNRFCGTQEGILVFEQLLSMETSIRTASTFEIIQGASDSKVLREVNSFFPFSFVRREPSSSIRAEDYIEIEIV